MDTFANVFDDMVILTNAKLAEGGDAASKTWMARVQEARPGYEPSTQYDGNKTLIFGHGGGGANRMHVVAMDVFMTTATIVVPASFVDFVDIGLPSVVKYLVCTIKAMVSQECANELRFRLCVYMPMQHAGVSKMRYSTFFTSADATRPTKTIFGGALHAAMCRFDLDFAFNEDWTIRPSKRTFMDFNAVKLF